MTKEVTTTTSTVTTVTRPAFYFWRRLPFRTLQVLGAVQLFFLYQKYKGYTIRNRPTLQVKLIEPLTDTPAPVLFGTGKCLFTALECINYARVDPNIKLELRISDPGSLSDVQELRDAILLFRSSGKPAVAHLCGTATPSAYALAVACSEVVMEPHSILEVHGPSSFGLFFRNFLERWKVDLTVSRNSEHKSFPDIVLNTGFSETHRKTQMNLLLSLCQQYCKILETSKKIRDKSFEEVVSLISSGPYLAHEAMSAGLINSIGHPSYLQAEGSIGISSYYKQIPKEKNSSKIGIIFAEGEIAELGSINLKKMQKVLQKAYQDDEIKAVVLRVNSPGGAVDESDRILHLLNEFQTHKPIVVSFGSVAASGGYWISSNANHIVANPASITGSIGVFSIMPHIGRALEEFGVTSDIITTTSTSLAEQIFLPTTEGKQFMQRSVDNIATSFEQKLVNGRRLSPENAKLLANGEVFTGEWARDNGLVDTLGGLHTAIAKAKRIAKIEEGPTSIKLITDLNFEQAFVRSLGLNTTTYNQWKLLLRAPFGSVMAMIPYRVKN